MRGTFTSKLSDGYLIVKEHPIIAAFIIAILALVATIFVIQLRWHFQPYFMNEPGGIIIVDSPEVYSRERLVNDRFKQQAFLNERLDETKGLPFGNQAILDLQSIVETKANLNVDAKISGSPKDNNIEEGKSTQSSTANSSANTSLSTYNHGGDQAQTAKNSKEDAPVSSPIERFRDMLAYREEVRSEIMETRLDDRHDIRGSTLYRLKFDTTILPHGNSSSWAIVEVDLSRENPIEEENKNKKSTDRFSKDDVKTYCDWIEKSGEEFRSEHKNMVTNFLSKEIDSETLTSFFKFLNRENYNFNKQPGYTQQNNILEDPCSCKEKKESNNLFDKYSCLDRWRYCLDIHYQAIKKCDQNFEWYYKNGLANIDVDKVRGLIPLYIEKKLSENNKKTFSRYEPWIEKYVKNAIEKVDTFNAIFRESEKELRKLQDSGKKKEAEEKLEDIYCGNKLQERKELVKRVWRIEREFLEKALGDYLVERYSEDHGLSKFADISLVGCERGYCLIDVRPHTQDICSSTNENSNSSGDKHLLDFFNRLNDAPIYSYTVTPKESVQRIAEIGSQMRTSQFMIGMAASFSNAKTDSLIEYLDRNQNKMQEIKRNPLVVGFSSADPLEGGMENNSTAHHGAERKNYTAKFGWIIGPKFDLGEEDDVRFVHVPIQNALSAIVSVPTWWKNLYVTVTTCWRSPSDPKLAKGMKDKKICTSESPEKNFPIRLPGDVNEIKRKLGYSVGHIPFIKKVNHLEGRRKSCRSNEQHSKQIGSFYNGQTNGVLAIEGGDLWRSTVVTVGSQKADRIEVLPNMHGILARFDNIQMPYQWTGPCYADAEVVVWTSEGRTEEYRFARIFQTVEQYEHEGEMCYWENDQNMQIKDDFNDSWCNPWSLRYLNGQCQMGPSAGWGLFSTPGGGIYSRDYLVARHELDQLINKALATMDDGKPYMSHEPPGMTFCDHYSKKKYDNKSFTNFEPLGQQPQKQ